MKALGKRKVFLLATAVAIATWMTLAFRGDLDKGHYVVIQEAAGSQARVATLAERLGTGWGGNTFFVFLSDHPASPPEVRKALYGSQLLFEVGRGNLELFWASPRELLIRCLACEIAADAIQVRRTKYQDVTIRYVGFPDEEALR